MKLSIAEVVRLTGTTSRALRHYGDIGLLTPSSVGANGLRYYDQVALTRLQRILLLRQMGVGLPAIADALDAGVEDADALSAHLVWLESERERLGRQIATVSSTIEALKEGREMAGKDMFDGFDHTQYREEVEERWGKDAYARSDSWWRGLGPQGQQAFKDEASAIADAWRKAHREQAPIDSGEVRELARRHVAWISAGWGGATPTAEQVAGLAQMYVSDERFAANYGGVEGAAYVRDALVAHVGHGG